MLLTSCFNEASHLSRGRVDFCRPTFKQYNHDCPNNAKSEEAQ